MFEKSELGIEQCSGCGQKYNVVRISLPLKDKDDFSCDCGQQLRQWKETAMYQYESINKEN